VTRARLKLALEKLESGDWARFERFASDFLAGEYPNLRTVARPSGDRGRDAELFSPTGQARVVLQYSVSGNWDAKIKTTLKRISETIPDAQILVYVTNQQLGARCDDLRLLARNEHGVFLDAHDRDWFLERIHRNDQTLAAAGALAADVVDPFLASRGIIDQQTRPLTEYERRSAIVFLQLQWEDETREKGLTKICFEALVRSVLRGTSNDSRMTRVDIQNRVAGLLPDHESERIHQLTDNALLSLKKHKLLTFWGKEDSFCLSHDEKERVEKRVAEVEAAALRTAKEFERAFFVHRLATGLDEERAGQLGRHAAALVEKLLLQQGEEFAQAVVKEKMPEVPASSVRQVASRYLAEHAVGASADEIEMLNDVVVSVLRSPEPSTQHWLRSVSDTYTLFSFLIQAPDVQRVARRIFSHGVLFVDTTVLLPALLEQLDAPGQRIVTKLLSAAVGAGIELRATPGVVEELDRHFGRSLAYCHCRGQDWHGGDSEGCS
jgi:hypothetical protein